MKKLIIGICLVLLIAMIFFMNNKQYREVTAPVITFIDKTRIMEDDLNQLDQLYTVESESIISINHEYTIEDDTIEVCASSYDESETRAIACKQYEFYEPVWFKDTSMTLQKRIEDYLIENEVNSDNIAYFYYDTVSQEDISFHEQQIFLAASTVKVSLVMAYQDLIDEGKISSDDELYFADYHYEASYNDLIKYYPIGSTVPVSVLMEWAIQYSDNSATYILMTNYKKYSGIDFRHYLADEFAQQELTESFYIENQISAQIQENVLKKLIANADKYTKLINDMNQAYPDSLIKANDYKYEVYHKYGYYDVYLHDMAIVGTEQPILIGIFTQYELNGQLITDIASIMIEYNLIHQG